MNDKLTTYIIPTLLIGEFPTLVFTFFDYYHLFSKYRENDRLYPTFQNLQDAFYPYIRNVIGILLFGYIGMNFIIYTNLNFYDMSNNINIFSFIYQWFFVSLFTEFLFYWLHRYVHVNKDLYYYLHASHHRWKNNSFALVNHDLEIIEIAIFSFCPAIPCIVLGVNWQVMMFHAMYTNWQGTYSHSGYHIPILDYLLLVDSRNHDNHHKYPNYNFAGGSMFNLMDKIFHTHRYIT